MSTDSSHSHTRQESLPRGSMNFAFILTMPNNNAWNGKWSGDDKLYARVKSFSHAPYKAQCRALVGNHYYNFGDGWGANVEVKEITSEEKRKLLKRSEGFCGYDWMIDSLIQYGRIMNDVQRRKHIEAHRPDDLQLKEPV